MKKVFGRSPGKIRLGAISLLLAAALIGSVFVRSGTAQAVTSLPYIEQLVTSMRDGETFSILEIVPETGGGSIGYYIDGEEATAGWTAAIANLDGAAARSAYFTSSASGLFTQLTNAGLMSTGDSTPLTAPVSSVYTERKVWENTTGMKALNLTHMEESAVTGTFTTGAAGSGPYREDVHFSLNAGGDYVQDVAYFAFGNQGTGYYYYSPAFSDPLPDLSVPADGTAVYTAFPAEAVGTDIQHYVYYGTVGDEGFGMESGKNYYVVESTGAPSTVYDGAHTYAAFAPDGFKAASAAGSGYFDRITDSYTYVGAGLGDTKYSSAGSEAGTIRYSVVYYSGGYTNNNWFLKYAFDQTSYAELDVQVQSVLPGEVTADMIADADLVVLSAGMDISNVSGGVPAGLADHYDASNDLSDDTAYALYTAMAADVATEEVGTPVVVDYRLAALPGDLNVSRLARICMTRSLAGTFTDISESAFQSFTWNAAAVSDADKNFVAGTLYCFNPDAVRGALATDAFADAYGSEVGFEQLTAEITYENFLREQEHPGTSDKLTPEASIATAVRYVISVRGQRVVNAKEHINVLEIQPRNVLTSHRLTPATVLGWLGGTSSGLTTSDITVTTMSASEFIGKIEDLNETYDMIYIGSSTDGFYLKTSGGTTYTDYNDTSMRGLLYSNIGDTYYSSYGMAGLLDRDYYGSYIDAREPGVYGNGSYRASSNLFRFSGNDFTPAKVEALENFAAAGYPVILANDLVSGSAAVTGNYTFTVSITAGTADGDSVALTAVPTVPSYPGYAGGDDYTVSYQWYRADDTVITGATSNVYDAPAGGSYYCKATVVDDDHYITTTSSARSEVYQVTNDACGVTGGGAGTPGSYQTESGTAHLIPNSTTWYGTYPNGALSGYSDGGYTSFWNNVTMTRNSWDWDNSCYAYFTVSLPAGTYVLGGTFTTNWWANNTTLGVYTYAHGSIGSYIAGMTVGSSQTNYTPGDVSFTLTSAQTVAVRFSTDDGWNPGVTVKNISLNTRFDFSANATWISSGNFSASVNPSAPPSGYVYRYEWQRKNNGADDSTYTTAPGTATNASYTTTQSGTYRCRVYLTETGSYVQVGTSAYTQAYKKNGALVTSTTQPGQAILSGGGGTATTTYAASASYGVSGTSVTLTAVPDPITLSGGYSYSYRWYKNDSLIPGETDSVYTATAPASGTDAYFCRVTASAAGATPAQTGTVSITRQSSAAPIAGSIGGTFAYNKPADRAPDGDLVDNSSKIYEAMDNILGRLNVMKVSEAQANSNTLMKYLNLSKPEIVFASSDDYPVVYEDLTDTLTKEDGAYYLRYRFSIENLTDATPASTRYDVRLYVDMNADGRYASGEALTDLVVRTTDGALVMPAGGVYSLSAGVTYTLTRQMPDEYSGIIPWKLEVVKNGARQIHASRHDYTRIAPASGEEKEIRILQINSDGGNALDLESQMDVISQNTSSDCYSAVTNKTYMGIYGKLIADVQDFSVSITTVTADTLESSSDGESFTRAGTTYHMDDYDMLIIGFDDCYKEIGDETAQGIVDFINTGKAVLFTHDTTSHTDTTADYAYLGVSGHSSVYKALKDYISRWGYYFNTVVRSPVGLDRYGIVSADYKNTLKTGASLGSATAAALEADDYSVAYKPKSDKAYTVPETQGYTSYEMMRFDSADQYNYTDHDYSAGHGSTGNAITYGVDGQCTTYVSQVNEGQITTYPFNLNTVDFGGSMRTKVSGSWVNDVMRVGATHEQYYQINMNSDDIVVWYCLSGAGVSDAAYTDIPNDVVNSYYIYNKGNVTYSGVGHMQSGYPDHYMGSSIDDMYENEAKLFVNTMIAAYRTEPEPPTVAVTNADGELLPYLLFKDDGGVLESVMEGDDSRAAYFVVTDPNLTSSGKTISAEFYYYDNDGNKVAFLNSSGSKVYVGTTGTQVSVDALSSGTPYRFYVPDGALQALAEDERDFVEIYVTVTTTIGTGSSARDYTSESPAILTLRKVGLFTLR